MRRKEGYNFILKSEILSALKNELRQSLRYVNYETYKMNGIMLVYILMKEHPKTLSYTEFFVKNE